MLETTAVLTCIINWSFLIKMFTLPCLWPLIRLFSIMIQRVSWFNFSSGSTIAASVLNRPSCFLNFSKHCILVRVPIWLKTKFWAKVLKELLIACYDKILVLISLDLETQVLTKHKNCPHFLGFRCAGKISTSTKAPKVTCDDPHNFNCHYMTAAEDFHVHVLLKFTLCGRYFNFVQSVRFLY